MNLFRGHPPYPKDRDLVRVVRAAASRLAGKLDRLDAESLDLSTEARRLLQHPHKDLRAHIERCAHVFAWSLPRNEKPFTDLVLVAFNDGIGVFSLLAKECSIGTVVYHDSSDVLRSDARTIAHAIAQPADHYVFGDTEEIEFIAKKHSITCDMFVSCDAVEGSRRLAPLLNALSEPSKGAISFGLALEEQLPSRSMEEGRAATDLTVFCEELGRAGFDVSVVRGPSAASLRRNPVNGSDPTDDAVLVADGKPLRSNGRSGRCLVLRGSRLAGTPIPNEERLSAATPPRRATALERDPESREILIR